MNDTQRLFLQINNPVYTQPAANQPLIRRTYTIYLTGNQNRSTFIPPQPSQNPLGEIILGFGFGVALFGGVMFVTEILNELFSPVRNDEPLTATTKRFIRERDGETCFYCEDYVPDGHVDHCVSRVNGGGNEPENLTWACAFCNCSKGALNDTDYIRLL